MTETEARRLIYQADMKIKSGAGVAPYFWQGYREGVRRALHGAAYNQERHELFMAVVPEDEFDDARRLQVQGYRAGLAGLAPQTLNPEE